MLKAETGNGPAGLGMWTLPKGRGQRTLAAPLGLMVSSAPTQAEVQAVANKLDELLTALRRV